MKSQKILSLFLAVCLTLSLASTSAAAAGETEVASESQVAVTETVSSESEPVETESEASASTEHSTFTLPNSVLQGDNSQDSVTVSISGTAALLVDENTRTVLFAQNETGKVFPASTTKIMTALLTLEAIERGELSLNTVVTITDAVNADVPSNSTRQKLVTGEEISIENLLYCLLVASANDAANALAIAVSGTVSNFVTLMNQRATELGCTGTHFVNPHGLHDDNHYTTCVDLYLITEAAWQYPAFQSFVATDEYYVPETNKSDERHMYNTNLLLSEKKGIGYMYKYTVGVKTGTTTAAGQCLVAAAEYKGRLLFSVEMGCQNGKDADGNLTRPIYTETAQLFRHGFLDFYPLTVAKADDLVTQVDVSLGKGTDFVLVSPANDVEIELVKGLSASDFIRVFNLPDSVSAPVSAGDVVGTMDLIYKGEVYATVDLVAVSDVELSVSEQFGSLVRGFFHSPVVKIVLIALCILIVFLVVLLASSLTRRNRERTRRRSNGSRYSSNNKHNSGRRTR